ncbi:cytochrome c oxidase-assembly factor COX23, mitochondrial-like, partial [Malus domestica]|uniref:cytochrome c oxidase-assembly factor COX23, mitochondrial-like n=1 Tax=Malus domestica TaxID=3750 RepID=UPI0007EDCD35
GRQTHRVEQETARASGASTPPYPSAARISDSQCYPQYTASLKCLEENNSDKIKCQEHFDMYKECKKKERLARLERNKTRSLFS